MSQIEILLRRYAEGTITPEEQCELDQLTHRNLVVEGSKGRARRIRRRRSARAAAVASVAAVAVAGAFVFFRPPEAGGASYAPVLASAEPSAALAAPAAGEHRAPAEKAVEKSVSDAGAAAAVQPQPAAPREAPAAPAEAVETLAVPATAFAGGDSPVVACNSQCSPDSVINDIWNFLRV